MYERTNSPGNNESVIFGQSSMDKMRKQNFTINLYNVDNPPKTHL
jgi:hypothetical protein